MSIHRTDCVNIIHLSEAERARLIDAEWETNASDEAGGQYMSGIKMYANNRKVCLWRFLRYLQRIKLISI